MTQSEESTTAIEKIRLQLLENKNKVQNIKPDSEKVLIAEMQINALLQMTQETNEIFSQIRESEVFDVSRAILFSRDCLPSISQRLKTRDIEFIFQEPILEAFIKENFRHMHKANRKRVPEFLQGLEAVSPRTEVLQGDRKPSILDRLR